MNVIEKLNNKFRDIKNKISRKKVFDHTHKQFDNSSEEEILKNQNNSGIRK